MEQVKIHLSPRPRGFHVITEEVLQHLPELPQTGILHLFIQHTSAGICINENADPSVLKDMNNWYDKNIKENEPYYEHTLEGPDDMPSHIKAVFTGCEVHIPISNGQLALGTWQGIYLGEFRDRARSRTLLASIIS
ncbi:MAG: YjbQ family protein [Crocinitomicaceae bacterium]|nr:YjbQ family protein [Crocinitomicaceae bacterium]